MLVDRAPAPLAPLPDPYPALFGRALDRCVADERVRGLWLSGSLARGAADAGSDLDLVLAIRDDDFEAFAADWPAWLESITPTLIARALPKSNVIIYALTTECARLDLVCEPVSRLPTSFSRSRYAVLDRDGLDGQVPAAADRPGPDPDRIAALLEEFWRQQAITPAMVDGRHDLLVAVVGAQQAHQILYDVFVAANQPLPPMGVKQWSSRLTDAQRQVLEALPTAAPDRESIGTAMAAIRAAMCGAGRAAAEAAGATWPEQLADTVTAYVESALADPAA